MVQYVTKEGRDLIKQEFNDIWLNLRPDVTQKLAWAASLGDRSENADYQYNKKRLREIDLYVKYLSDTIQDLEVLDRSVEGMRDKKVYFGAYVEIENDAGDIKHFWIVGGPEIYGRSALISIQSPIAKGLLNNGLDDEAIVKTPKGNVSWYINKISYKHEDWFGPISDPEFHFSNKKYVEKTKILSYEELKKIKNNYLEKICK